MREYQICTNCVMDTSDSKIAFDENGMCDHCHNYYDNILPIWQHGKNHERELEKLLQEIKEYGKGKPYDCLIGLSGGLDSSYLAYTAVKIWGLNPKFITIDTHWNLPVANDNVRKIIDTIGAEIETITVDWEELKDLQIAYFKSQVPYQDTPQDAALFAASYNYAAKMNVRYILNGGNHSTECIREPVEWTHINDMTLLLEIHKRFGTKPLVKYPTLSFFRKNLYYRYFKNMKILKPLDLIPYNKQDVIELLAREFGWQPYQHKHYENRFTRFYEGYWKPKKFGYNPLRAHYSSLIVTEQMGRDEVIEMLKQPSYDEALIMEDMEYITNKLGMTKDEFISLMNEPNKTYKDYKSNKWLIESAIKLARFVGIEKRNYR